MHIFNFLSQKPLVNVLARSVTRLYRSADSKTKRFSSKAGFKCPPGCGHCCEFEGVSCSVLEFLPLACELWKKGDAGYWLDRISSAGPSARCVFYEKDTREAGGEHCRIYVWRPLVCRLFGFSCLKDKHGKSVLAACSVLKRIAPGKVEKAGSITGAPVMTDLSSGLAAIDPALSRERLNINEAAKIALEKVGVMMEIGSSSSAIIKRRETLPYGKTQ